MTDVEVYKTLKVTPTLLRYTYVNLYQFYDVYCVGIWLKFLSQNLILIVCYKNVSLNTTINFSLRLNFEQAKLNSFGLNLLTKKLKTFFFFCAYELFELTLLYHKKFIQ